MHEGWRGKAFPLPIVSSMLIIRLLKQVHLVINVTQTAQLQCMYMHVPSKHKNQHNYYIIYYVAPFLTNSSSTAATSSYQVTPLITSMEPFLNTTSVFVIPTVSASMTPVPETVQPPPLAEIVGSIGGFVVAVLVILVIIATTFCVLAKHSCRRCYFTRSY